MRHPRLDPRKYDIAADDVREVLDYCPETGDFRWRFTAARPRNWNRNYAGKRAGYINNWGRRVIALLGPDKKKRRYYANVLAWVWMTGKWPETEVDHRDTDKANDAWDNLRLATQSQNMCNTTIMSRNTSGHKGVSWSEERGKWAVYIKAGARNRCVGRFNTIEEAVAARAIAAAELHGEFARTS